jgi:hypothetical protein
LAGYVKIVKQIAINNPEKGDYSIISHCRGVPRSKKVFAFFPTTLLRFPGEIPCAGRIDLMLSQVKTSPFSISFTTKSDLL